MKTRNSNQPMNRYQKIKDNSDRSNHQECRDQNKDRDVVFGRKQSAGHSYVKDEKSHNVQDRKRHQVPDTGSRRSRVRTYNEEGVRAMLLEREDEEYYRGSQRAVRSRTINRNKHEDDKVFDRSSVEEGRNVRKTNLGQAVRVKGRGRDSGFNSDPSQTLGRLARNSTGIDVKDESPVSGRRRSRTSQGCSRYERVSEGGTSPGYSRSRSPSRRSSRSNQQSSSNSSRARTRGGICRSNSKMLSSSSGDDDGSSSSSSSSVSLSSTTSSSSSTSNCGSFGNQSNNNSNINITNLVVFVFEQICLICSKITQSKFNAV